MQILYVFVLPIGFLFTSNSTKQQVLSFI